MAVFVMIEMVEVGMPGSSDEGRLLNSKKPPTERTIAPRIAYRIQFTLDGCFWLSSVNSVGALRKSIVAGPDGVGKLSICMVAGLMSAAVLRHSQAPSGFESARLHFLPVHD